MYHWRVVRSLVWDMGSNYYDPMSAFLTYFLTLLQFQKRIPLKPRGRRVGVLKQRGETRRGNPLLRLHQCMCMSVYVEAAEIAQQSQRDYFPAPWGEYNTQARIGGCE